MNGPGLLSPYDASPAQAVASIRAFDGPLLLDFDETLYLRNSTEDFIGCARPAVAALLLLKLLDLIKPWRWTGGGTTRDVWRVRLICLLFPWTRAQWRRLAPHLAQRFTNQTLLGALRDHPTRPIIVTLGFDSVVTPLVAALDLPASQIISSRYGVFEDRRRGKLALVLDALGHDTVQRGLVLTDSIDDLPLLDACARPLRTLWPEARYHSALGDTYLPGRYLSQVKRPGERYILRGILKDDFAFWVLSSILLASAPLQHALGLLLLLLSFWAVYECGYVDNDRIAARFEAEPKLSRAFANTVVATPRWEPWIWALLSGVLAIFVLRWPDPAAPADLGKWLLVLLATHGWFRLYNRFDKPTRVWLYAGLQLARSAAFVVLVPIAATGALAIAAHVLAKWMPYYIYRSGTKGWPDDALALTRLLFFSVMLGLLALTQEPAQLLNATTAVLLAWNLFRARHGLLATVRGARRIDHPRP